MSLERLPNESYLDWKYRLLIDKTIGELDENWEEISKALNLGMHKDSVRKGSIFLPEFKEYLEEKLRNTTSEEQIEEMKEMQHEMYKLKTQLSDERREIRRYLRHEGRLENLLQVLLEEIKDDMNSRKPLEWVKPILSEDSSGALALLLSDLHKGMVTDNHWNKYNDEIFYERLNKLTNDVLNYQKITNTKEIHVYDLGDNISGVIHRLTKLTETEDAVKSTQKVAEALSELLSVLANNFETVHYYNVKGNHDRVSARKEEEVRTESFHDFIAWYMKARLEKFENIIFHDNELDTEIIVSEILGRYYFAVHGHLDKLSNVVQNLTLMTKIFPTAVFTGHYHKNFENEVHGIDLIVNGSFGGVDDYAKDSRYTGKAHQKLLWLDENGRKATFYINLN